MKIYYDLPADFSNTFDVMNYINSICEKIDLPLFSVRPVFHDDSFYYECFFSFLSDDGHILDIVYNFSLNDLSLFRVFNIQAICLFEHLKSPNLLNRIVLLALGSDYLYIDDSEVKLLDFLEEYFSLFRHYKSRQMQYKNRHCDNGLIFDYYSFVCDYVQKLQEL